MNHGKPLIKREFKYKKLHRCFKFGSILYSIIVYAIEETTCLFSLR
jgi:hypothetical protein